MTSFGMTASPRLGADSLYARHPKTTLLVLNAVLCPLLLASAEMLLRASGVITLRRNALANVAPLHQGFCAALAGSRARLAPLFLADAEGIFKANPQYDFSSDPAWRYLGVHINSAGFRGQEFLPRQDDSKTLLLLGDSFTWGAFAEPLSQSFADRLERAGYQVWNAGIPGVDPTQYARLAQKWVPILKPRVTAVFVFIGNDVEVSPMEVKPNEQLWYVATPGVEFLSGYDEYGVAFSGPEAVLPYYRRTYCGQGYAFWDSLSDDTALGKLFHDLRVARKAARVTDTSRAWVRLALAKIQAVCARYHSEFVLFLIPMMPSVADAPHSLRGNLALFEGFDPHYPSGLREGDYDRHNQHLNNRGHRKYFRFVSKVLKRSAGPTRNQ
jgi:hypothetical protein